MGELEVKKSINSRLRILLMLMGFISLLFFLATSVCIVLHSGKTITLQEQRIMYSKVVKYAETKAYRKIGEYSYYIVGLDGVVFQSSIEKYPVGRRVNLHTLSTSSADVNGEQTIFITPLLDAQGQFGTMVIIGKQSKAISLLPIVNEIAPLIVLLIIIFICLFLIKRYIKREIIGPIKNLVEDLDATLKGNYQCSIHQANHKNEFGVLSCKVEMLRDELVNYTRQAELLHENEKMLLACVSHDLKTPISTIMGSAEMIRDSNSISKDGILHYVEIILRKSQLLTKLINDILNQENAELDTLKLNQKEIYARKFMEDVRKELVEDVDNRGLEMEWGEVPDVLLNIVPDRIFQVFQNVIENSIKYTQPGGKIEVSFNLEYNSLAVNIADNGQGIAAVDIPFVFERFYRGEKARTQKEKTGSGLGLSIVKNILEHHGTRVECDSVLGEGTTIHFTLPLA